MSILNFLQNNKPNIKAKGKSGLIYNFNLNSKSLYFSSLPGVYIFIRKESNQLIPLYIGETENFDNRIGLLSFRNHDQYECITKNKFTNVATLIVHGGKQKDWI